MQLIIVFSNNAKSFFSARFLANSKYILLKITVDKVVPWICSHGGIYSARPYPVRIDFSSNVNPLGISNKVLTALKKELPTLSLNYPDPDCMDFKRALIKYLDDRISYDQIVVGNGATEIIDIFAKS